MSSKIVGQRILGDVIRELRLDLALSSSDLAQQSLVSEKCLLSIERGEMDLDSLEVGRVIMTLEKELCHDSLKTVRLMSSVHQAQETSR